MEANDKLEMLLDYTGLKILPFSKSIGQGSQTFYDIRSGKIQSFTADVSNKIVQKYPEINKEWLIGDDANMINAIRPDKKDEALQQLEKIQHEKIKNTNGKYHNESKIVPDEEVIKIKTYVIPIKGFAGLKKALFDDMYISENFNQSTTEVPKALYASISYRVQSSGNSMPGIIPENAWVTGVPIPEQDWIDYNFKPNKVYVLFHPYRGILFKYVENQKNNEIKLYSKNSDKIEYPDENFLITEFRKILVAIKVETFI